MPQVSVRQVFLRKISPTGSEAFYVTECDLREAKNNNKKIKKTKTLVALMIGHKKRAVKKTEGDGPVPVNHCIFNFRQ